MQVPTICVQKEMQLGEVAAARATATPRPSWCSIFTKAYAKVVAGRRELRQVFLSVPWERLFEYRETSADIMMDVPFADENLAITATVSRPESRSFLDIDQALARSKEDPLRQLRCYRRAHALARWPRFLRRWVWWYLLNVSGSKRARYFGTFGVTGVSKWGVELLTPRAPLTSLLHYDKVDAQGNGIVRLTFDHRVLDGSGGAKAMLELEQLLNTEILAELRSLDKEIHLQAKAG